MTLLRKHIPRSARATSIVTAIVSAALSSVLATSAFAGRPLTVDDAATNNQGEGHVEAWYARMPGKAHTWNVSPAYAPIEGLEFSGLIARDTTNKVHAQALQFKWIVTPPQDSGCNAGVVGGIGRARAGGITETTPYLNGLVTCRSGSWAMHANLGSQRPENATSVTTWGLAVERQLGAFTAHAEAFGERHGRPTRQVGLRTELRPGLQIDGTIGRGESTTVYSVGLKQSF